MKKILILITVVFMTITFTACNTSQNNNTAAEPEVIVKMPDDDTVNGYRTQSKTSGNSIPDKISGNDVTVGSKDNTNNSSKEYCANKNSKVFHKSSCNSVSTMKDKNKYYASRDTLIKEGYSPCGKCNP